MPGSPGVVFGKAYVVTRSFNFSIENGRILVAPMTDPDMVPEIAKSLGIITDRGGVISHAAIIAREIGIPCIVGTGNATKLINTMMISRLMEIKVLCGFLTKRDIRVKTKKLIKKKPLKFMDRKFLCVF